MQRGLKKKETSRWGFKGSSKTVVKSARQQPNLELRNITVLSPYQLRSKTADGQGKDLCRSEEYADRRWARCRRDPSSLSDPGCTQPAATSCNYCEYGIYAFLLNQTGLLM